MQKVQEDVEQKNECGIKTNGARQVYVMVMEASVRWRSGDIRKCEK